MAAKKSKVTIKYQYADGSPGEVVKEIYGKSRVQAEVEYIKTWLINHQRTVTEITVE